ncbi:NHLP bacteriocin system secretion protein [Oceanibaculum nanhaiense]|uniref:NHLP bacteriocin system secretion protein n=1 Tax=Oceanibaculum nanhaiense TaxID=1909734 RepID=UPI00396D0CF9
MSDGIFRKTALERLSSPDQLDRLITVTRPRGWMALVMLCVIAGAAIAWGILGSIPTRVQGNGILISTGGQVVNVQAPGSGTLSEIDIRVGEEVSAGQIVARLSQTDAAQRYENALAVVEEKLDNQRRVAEQADREWAVKQQNFDRRRAALRDRLTAGQQRLDFLRGRLADEEKLLTDKVITREVVARTRDEANRAAQEVAEVRNDLARIEAEALDLLATLDNRRRTAEDAVSEARRQLAQVEATLNRATIVIAPASGTVTEVKVSQGALVTEGQSLFAFQSGGAFLDLVLYIPPQHGKRVKPGMPVQISPSTAKREEYGTALGSVEWVSDFPATLEGIRSVLQNDELARNFQQGGPPYVARVALERDTGTVSGYRWSSTKGATLALSGGTLASAEITVSEQAPVTLIIPLLREYTGLF